MSSGTQYVIEKLGQSLAESDKTAQQLYEHATKLEQKVAQLETELAAARAAGPVVMSDQPPAIVKGEVLEGEYDSSAVAPDLDS